MLDTKKATQLYKPTDYDIDRLSLISYTGKSIDISNIFVELNIYEDIYSPTISGDVIVNDTTNLIDLLPLSGFDYISIVFGKPTHPKKYEKTFRIYKVTDRKKETLSAESYIIHFASEEAILSQQNKLSKSYKGFIISDIVKDICRKNLGITSAKLKDENIQETFGIHDLIIPYITPFSAIVWLSKMARPKFDKSVGFLFFENRDGFRYVNLETLYEKSSVVNLDYAPKNISPEESTEDSLLSSARGPEFIRNKVVFDVLKNYIHGIYNSTMVTFDPIRQISETNFITYENTFKNSKKLNKNPFSVQLKNRLGQLPTESYGAHVNFSVTNTEQTNSSYIKARQKINPFNVERWMLQRTHVLSSLNMMRVEIVLPGTIDLTAGDTVNLSVPSSIRQDKSERKLDNLSSGKYLITSLRHKINRQTHACIIELSKDSLAESIPTYQGTSFVEELTRK